MKKENTFISVAFIFGILSILTASAIVGGFVFGGLAIIFAVLSKGGSIQLPKKSSLGMFAGILGIFLSIFFTVRFINMYQTDKHYRKQIDNSFMQIYGTTCERFFSDFVDTIINNYN